MSGIADVTLQLEYLPWYAVRTRPNHEKTVATILDAKGFETYLPFYKTRRRWSDRVVEATLPLFPGYVFSRFDIALRLTIVTTPSVVSVVSFANTPAPVAESEIEAIKTVLRSGLATEPCPFVKEGQRVRIERGSLEGVEGVLVKKKRDWRLVISVSMLQRSILVEIDHDWISVV